MCLFSFVSQRMVSSSDILFAYNFGVVTMADSDISMQKSQEIQTRSVNVFSSHFC